MTTDARTPTPEPIEDVVARDLSGWAQFIYNCTTGANYFRTQEYYDLICDLDRYASSLTAAEAERDKAQDMAAVGRALIDVTAKMCPDWAPADCPSEIVSDLVNARDEALAERDALRDQADHWHECFTVLERAIVGDTGASAITEAKRLRARVAGLEDRALELSVCLRNLVFMAETTGGTAGRDEPLCTVIAQARALLAPAETREMK